MADVNQSAYPTHMTSGLTKLERVASEQLAALILADNTTDAIIAPLEPCDMKQDDNGGYAIRNGRVICIPVGEAGDYPKNERYTVLATHYERLARQAVRYAKALLEMTQ